jgi:hypothetical protein
MSKDLIVVKVDKARALLAEARNATDAKKVADLAHAVEVYARRQKYADEAIADAYAIKIDARTLMGEFLQAAPKNKGTAGQLKGAGPGRGKTGSTKKVPPVSGPPTLADLGIDRKDSSEAQALATLKKEAPELHEEVRKGQRSTASARSQHRRRQEKEKRNAVPLVYPSGDSCRIECAEALDFFAAQPADSLDFATGSPDYPDARLYLENGVDLGIVRSTEQWVPWMVEVYKAALRCCTGLVAFVVNGRTQDYEYSAAPEQLIVALKKAGICVRKAHIFHRVGIPGSGGPDGLRDDYETVVLATRGGKLPWSDNTAMGHPPKYKPGGAPSYRRKDGSRVNANGVHGNTSRDESNNDGPHRARQRSGIVYSPPELSNPGNIINCVVGGGRMGDPLCHDNEAPFPEQLAEFLIRTYCRPGGIVCDPFCGSGTTLAVALRLGRRAIGCDLRQSQVDLSWQRVARVQSEILLGV